MIVEVDATDRELRESEEDVKDMGLRPKVWREASDSTAADSEEIEMESRKSRSSTALLTGGGPLTVDPEALTLHEEFGNWHLQDTP